MGEANRRGTKEQRIALAIERDHLEKLKQEQLKAEYQRLLEEQKQRELEAYMALTEEERESRRQRQKLAKKKSIERAMFLQELLMTLPFQTAEEAAKRRQR